MKKYYYVSSYPKIYKNSSDKLLSNEIKKLGYIYRTPGLGGGGGGIINHIIAYLSIDTNRDAIITGLLTNSIWGIMKLAFRWHKNNHIKGVKANPSVNIYIYTENKTKTYFVNIDANKEYSETEIENILKSKIS